VNGGFGEFGHVATKPVLCAVRDFVGGPKVQAGIDCDAGLGVELVTDPTQLDQVDAKHFDEGQRHPQVFRPVVAPQSMGRRWGEKPLWQKPNTTPS